MGNCMNKKGIGQKLTLAIVGLDNAGKTVTTKGLQGEKPDGVAPTVGFSSIDFVFDKYDITMFDLGGGKRIRDIWKNYFSEIYGLVYVIDSSAASRMEECRGVLEKLLKDDKISGKPILVLANKQDLPGALDEYDICEQLDLEELVNTYKTPCRVELCAAIVGQGKKLDKSIKQGMRWILATIEKNYSILNERVTRDTQRQREKEQEEKKAKAERVRKMREEREKAEKEQRRLRGEPESDQEEDFDPKNGDPFKRVDPKELAKKEQRLKEEKKKKKERKSLDETGSNPLSDEDKNNVFKGRHSLRSMDDSDIFAARSKRSLVDSPRPYRHGYGLSRSPSPPRRDEIGKGDLPWNRTPRPLDLAPLGSRSNNELNSTSRRGVLAPLGTLEPLESLDYGSLDRKSRKKKKKARKNQTLPGGTASDGVNAETGIPENGYDEPDADEKAPRGWPTPTVRASRSPRLDTVAEPDNETDAFSQKWGLVDELPELAEEDEEKPYNSKYGARPNSDSYDIMT